MLKDKLLLQTCCAPCASAVIERLEPEYDLTLFFFNPNIQPETEYQRRLQELLKLRTLFNFSLILGEYSTAEWQKRITGLENEPERGKRCAACIEYRLQETAKLARHKRFNNIATTLTLSPLKDTEMINKLGQKVAKEQSINYLISDFKKEGGYQRSLEISKNLGLQRQNYCGCLYAKDTVKMAPS